MDHVENAPPSARDVTDAIERLLETREDFTTESEGSPFKAWSGPEGEVVVRNTSGNRMRISATEMGRLVRLAAANLDVRAGDLTGQPRAARYFVVLFREAMRLPLR